MNTSLCNNKWRKERRCLLAASKLCLEWKESEQDIFHRCSWKNISACCHISSLLWQETLKFHVRSAQLIYTYVKSLQASCLSDSHIAQRVHTLKTFH